MGLLFDGGAIDDDLNVFAEQHPTGVEWGVEVNSKIFTVNGGGGLHPETGVAVGILGGAGDGDVQGYDTYPNGFVMVFGWGMLLLVAVATAVMTLIPWKTPVDEFEPIELEATAEEED